MKITPALLSMIVFLFSQAAMASDSSIDEGKHLYNNLCDSCHGATGGMDMSKRKAPPVAGVRLHYIGKHPEKAAFVKAITDWLAHQDASQSLMPGAIKKFNIMPPVVVGKEDAEKIALYIYQGELAVLPGFAAHAEKMHGKK